MNNLRVYRLKLRLFLFLGLYFSAINDMAVINNSLVLCKKMWMREREREREEEVSNLEDYLYFQKKGGF